MGHYTLKIERKKCVPFVICVIHYIVQESNNFLGAKNICFILYIVYWIFQASSRRSVKG